jgi:hypothetical protein
LAVTDLDQLPISYGERLILETVMKCRQRPYDRKRQEALAQPRRRGGAAEAWGVSGLGERSPPQGSTMRATTSGGSGALDYSSGALGPSGSGPLGSSNNSKDPRLTSDQEARLVDRLCQPKRRKPDASKTPGEAILLRNQDRDAKLKTGSIDVAAIVSRLSAPRAIRALSPTPGERVVLMWNRSENLRKPDPQRINELAQSSRRGGSARAWGVFDTPESARGAAPLAPMPSYPRPPDSARTAPRSRPGAKEGGPGYEGSQIGDSMLPPLV